MNNQRGFKSYGELTLNDILKMCEDTMGEWDGDNAGRLEDRASAAQELLNKTSEVLDLIISLEEEL